MELVSLFNPGRVPHARMLGRPEMYVLIHFGPNTFSDREWGYGDEDPANFAPDAFDADAMMADIRSGGFGGVILVCKHHDGFCLWPTRTTEHNISHSPWRGGKGDMVREFADAARRAGLKMGFYVSPWDRNNAAYGTDEYVRIFRAQLREILTQYGPAFEVWFDGANGGDGYYGGARTTRTIARGAYYGWRETWSMVRELQPGAAIFSDVGPDLRWVGNELGYAKPDCFATVTPRLPDGAASGDPAPGYCSTAEAGTGNVSGKYHLPPECDVPLRPGWFYHARQDDLCRSEAELVRIYLASVGEGGFLNIGLAPDKHGRLHPNDVARLREFRAAVESLFADELFRGGCAAAPGETAGFRFGRKVRLNLLDFREPEADGNRVTEYEIEFLREGRVVHTISGHAVGRRRLRLFAPVEADELRFRAATADGKPVTVAFAGYAAPEDFYRAEAEKRAITDRPDYRVITKKSQMTETAFLWELDAPVTAAGFIFVPYAIPDGMPDRYRCEVRGSDGVWREAARGEFSNIQANPIPQVVEFAEAFECAAVRLTAEHVVEPRWNPLCREFGLLVK